jgi:hypothetical protein
MRSFREDYAFGVASEEVVIDTLKEFFKDDTITKQGPTAVLDFIGNDYYELKTRTNKALAFPDTLFPKNKIDKYNGLKTNKKLYLVFAFTDGIKYIQYDPETFSTIQCEPFKRIARKDYNDKEQLYYYIPISLLLDII